LGNGQVFIKLPDGVSRKKKKIWAESEKLLRYWSDSVNLRHPNS